ncbi:MAG: SDR family oxidoreductase [Bacteroidales bacterium]|jgi:NAD(P)-dependent dehydrogenase (short-subunit alcohol dehydrogenase family)|nr:SDR family oxidoreductase [Bacteroidales bacterium]MBQ7672469.1 SDR family oxidoreductase [Paludibacteraceae bacterium]
MQVLVITGGSSGIGLATARLFAQKGWRVFELSRHERVQVEGVTHLDCDVTDEAQCLDAIDEVLWQEGQIDVLISNAGYGISGSVEFTDTGDAKAMFDVNFFGALNITKAVLPLMRDQRSGRILFTSSVAAPLSVPFQSMYSASKAALNDMALALQNEVRPFGIRVGVLMPGDVRTGFTAARQKNVSAEENQVYERAEKAVEAMEKDERNGMSPEQMARLFYRMATRRFLPVYNVGGGLYRLFCLLDKILPKSLVNAIEGKMY